MGRASRHLCQGRAGVDRRGHWWAHLGWVLRDPTILGGIICHGRTSVSREAVHGLILPEAFESVGRHCDVAHGMLNVLMPQIILNRSGIMSPRSQVIAARVPQLVGMGHKGQPGQLARSGHNLANGPRRQGRLALGDEDIW